MKQSILISAYKYIEHIKQIIDFFNDDFTFYIHIDKKSKIPGSAIEEIKKKQKSKIRFKKIYYELGRVKYT